MPSFIFENEIFFLKIKIAEKMFNFSWFLVFHFQVSDMSYANQFLQKMTQTLNYGSCEQEFFKGMSDGEETSVNKTV